ncbi:MAG: Mce-associated rane protein, partial [Mycobacterium sp.]|nr:Mce-associated rane protein [Mycobacterium sp.]
MRWRRWLIAVVGPVLVAAFVGLSAATGWLYWNRVETRGADNARAVLPQLAAKEIPQVFAYDYQTVER